MVIAKSFARIHKKNLINFGIVPVEAEVKADVLDELEISIADDYSSVSITNKTKGTTVVAPLSFEAEEVELLEKGGLLNLAN